MITCKHLFTNVFPNDYCKWQPCSAASHQEPMRQPKRPKLKYFSFTKEFWKLWAWGFLESSPLALWFEASWELWSLYRYEDNKILSSQVLILKCISAKYRSPDCNKPLCRTASQDCGSSDCMKDCTVDGKSTKCTKSKCQYRLFPFRTRESWWYGKPNFINSLHSEFFYRFDTWKNDQIKKHPGAKGLIFCVSV